MSCSFEAGSLAEPGAFVFQLGLQPTSPISRPRTLPWDYTNVQDQAWLFVGVLRCLLLTLTISPTLDIIFLEGRSSHSLGLGWLL